MRLVVIALGWCAGIVLAAAGTRPWTGWLVLALLTLIPLWLTRRQPGLRLAIAALLALMLGGVRMALVPQTAPVAAYNGVGGLTLNGLVAAEPDVRDNRVLLRLDVDEVTRAGSTTPVEGLVLVQAPAASDVRYGDRLLATGALYPPGEYDAFSYADFLAREGIYSVMIDTSIEVLARDQGSGWYGGLLALKDRARRAVADALPEPHAGLLTGILLGDERGIAPSVGDAFAATGTAHLLAISGFNMVILSGLVMRLLGRLNTPPRLAGLIGIATIALYTLLVGAGAAVVRAALMSALLVIAGLLRRKTFVPASLALVALLLSLVNPTVLWDIGFQLSFFATLGLALYADPLGRLFNRGLRAVLPSALAARVGDFLSEPLVVGLAAQVFTLPLTLVYFGRLSLVMLLVNVLVVPVQPVLLVVGGLAVLLAFVAPGAAQVVFWFTLPPLGLTVEAVRRFAALPYAQVEYALDSRLVALLFFVLIGGAMAQATQPLWLERVGRTVRSRALVVTAAFCAVCLLVLAGALVFSRPDGRLHVWFLDVGDGNAVLAQTPNGAHVLVDGGRFPSRLLTALGDRMPFNDGDIEVLVLTQPDDNEFAALLPLLERYRVGVFLSNGQPNVGENYTRLRSLLAETPTTIVEAGYRVQIDDGTRLDVLHPSTVPSLGEPLDDSALVMRLTYGEVSFLLTGDLSVEGQRRLLHAGGWPAAQVVQMPSHAAARSLDEAFLRAAQPQVAVVQVDGANRRGDPDGDTLALLDHALVFRTDQMGTVHFWTDGVSLWSLTEHR